MTELTMKTPNLMGLIFNLPSFLAWVASRSTLRLGKGCTAMRLGASLGWDGCLNHSRLLPATVVKLQASDLLEDFRACPVLVACPAWVVLQLGRLDNSILSAHLCETAALADSMLLGLSEKCNPPVWQD
jgi:hypothetical protein